MPTHPNLTWRSYLNYAGVGPLAAATRQAMFDAVTAQETRGVGAVASWLPMAQRARVAAASLIGASADQIGLVRSTSEAIQAVAHGIPWKRGDRIVLFEGEFPSNVIPWLLAAERHGLEVRWVPASAFLGPSGDGLARVAEAVQGARLVAVSAVQFQTGLRMPVHEITALAHAAGAEVLVDAIQAIGAVPFAAGEVDYVACGGHKWLMGPMGTAFLYARRWEGLRPELAGWLSQTDPFAFLGGPVGQLNYRAPFRQGPEIVEGSAQNFIGLAGLAVALELALEHAGADVQPLIDRAEAGLVARGFVSHRPALAAQRSAILSLTLPVGPTLAALAHDLGDRGVCVATPDGRLRIAPSWPTADEEIDVLLDAVDGLV